MLPTVDRSFALMYHRVGDIRHAAEATYAVSAQRFERQMLALADAGYRAVAIERFVAWLHGRADLRAGEFVLTFDDGYLGVRDHAWPVLQRLGWPFAVFLVTGELGGHESWLSRMNSGGHRHPLLGVDDVHEMQAQGVSFHSHTRSHASLTGLDDDGLREELCASRDRLRQLTGASEHYLAYPYGDVDDRVEAAARSAGYTAAFSVRPGFQRPGVEQFRIRRLDVHGTDTPAMLLRKVRLGTNDGRLGAMLRYYAGSLLARLNR